MIEQSLEDADIVSRFCRYQLVSKKNLPIRSSEMGLLVYVSKNAKPVTPLELSEFFHIAKPTVTEMVTRLTTSDYLIKSPSADDRRSYTVDLTFKGKQVVETALKDYLMSIEQLKKTLGDKDYTTLITLLDKANKVYEMEIYQ